MKRILVTGANGQLGQCIRKISDNYKELEFVFMGSESLDITKKNEADTIFEKTDFDYCINCAAYTNVEQAEKTPQKAFDVNADAVALLAKACKAYNVKLIHISTDYVFDGEKETPYTTEDTPNPINEYGKSKLKGEQLIQENMDEYFIVRTSWLYSEFGHNFFKTVLGKAKVGQTLYITDAQTGCPTNANNLAEFIVKSIIAEENGEFGICHFTDHKPMTWYGFAKEILRKNGLDPTTLIVRDNNYRSFARRPKCSILK